VDAQQRLRLSVRYVRITGSSIAFFELNRGVTPRGRRSCLRPGTRFQCGFSPDLDTGHVTIWTISPKRQRRSWYALPLLVLAVSCVPLDPA